MQLRISILIYFRRRKTARRSQLAQTGPGRSRCGDGVSRSRPTCSLTDRVVTFIGTDLDESLMAHLRLPKVIAQHAGTMKVLQTLRPFAVAMAGAVEFNPFKD